MNPGGTISLLVKVVILGDGNVGKTSLVRRYCEGKFEQSRVMTIGVDFQTKVVNLPDLVAKLSIWDVAGQERFQTVRENFYRGSRAAVLAYDLTQPETLLHLPRWQAEIYKVVPNIPFVVVGNKLDLVQGEGVTGGAEFARSIQAVHIRTSARTGEGVAEMFATLARLGVKFVTPRDADRKPKPIT